MLIYCTFLPALFMFSGEVMAQGNLLVTPKRVVMEGSKKTEILNLANIGKDSATFLISFIQIRMKEDGTFEKITEPDSAQYFADKYVRIFPRTVTLAPNEAQTVRIQLTKLSEMLPGEYRSHLYFRAVPSGKPLGEKEVSTDTSITVKLVPVFGISVPVILRRGESNAEVSFSDVAFFQHDRMPALKMTFNRKGSMSVYGDLTVDHISTSGKITQVGTIKGLAVYTPNAKRLFQLLLNKDAGIDYSSGKLRLTYTDQSEKPFKLAEYELQLRL
ncbi:MAG TPA: hypothetical protein VD993_19085 [Chitinophagaceae bacterium]|nr:hypothetical protein [Chitinophagaceae bacterium]